MLDWCVAAAQEKNETSLINIGTLEPAVCQDSEFLDWCDQRITGTLGEEVRGDGATQRRDGPRDLQLVEKISNNM